METEALLQLYETLWHYSAWALGGLAGLYSLFTGMLLAVLLHQEFAAGADRHVKPITLRLLGDTTEQGGRL